MTAIEALFGYVATYGLPVIALSAYFSCLAFPIPTFAVMLAGGAFAASEDLVLWQVLLTAWTAAVLGDQTGFTIGRKGGSAILDRIGRSPSRGPLVARAREWVAEKGALGVFFSTWLVAPLGPWVNLAAGAAGMDRTRFTLWDATGEAIWVGFYVTLGYLFSSRLTDLASVLGDWAGLVTSGVITLVLGWQLIKLMRRKSEAAPG